MGTELQRYHRFLDEAGDMNFFGKARIPLLHSGAVSKYFIMGLVTFSDPLVDVRKRVQELQKRIAEHPYLSPVPSVRKRAMKHGYFLHAKDDVPEIRMLAFEMIRSLNCEFKAIVAEKKYEVFALKHNNREAEFYADMLGHLIGTEMEGMERLVLTVARRSRCTDQKNLSNGLEKATQIAMRKQGERYKECGIAFNVQAPIQEPIINVVDYYLWALQRKLEKDEGRYFEFLAISSDSLLTL